MRAVLTRRSGQHDPALAVGVLVGKLITGAPAATTTGAGTVRLVVPTPAGVTEVLEPAVSPDGTFVVFAGISGSKGRQLYLQRLDQSAPQALARTDGAEQPLISPDGRWVAYQRANRFEKISVDGGAFKRLGKARYT